MTTAFLGISFLIQALLHWFGRPYMISKKQRNLDCIRAFQKGLVLPYSLIGIGFIVWGSIYNSFEEQNTFWYCAGIVVIAIISIILLIKNKKKYNI